jgi:hypothetical protein
MHRSDQLKMRSLSVDRSGPAIAEQWSFVLGSLLLAVGFAGFIGAVTVAALITASETLVPVLLLGGLFCSAFGLVWSRSQFGIIVVLGALLIIAPMRGGVLALAYEVGISNPSLTVNALQPTMIAAAALAALGRGILHITSPGGVMIVVGWLTFAVSAILNVATQTVGLEIYVLGLGQYLTYPTMAVLAWVALRPTHLETMSRVFLALAVLVSVSLVLEAFGLARFEESSPPTAAHLSLPRWGGSTGSYLHASIFLGTAAVLAAGTAIGSAGWRRNLVAGATLSVLFGGLFLTNSRGGFAIASFGVLALLIAKGWSTRLKLVSAVTASVALGLTMAYLVTIGSNPPVASSSAADQRATVGGLTERLETSADLRGDSAHRLRLEAMKRAATRFLDAPVPQQLFGEGVAATGNTRKLADARPVATESLPLKYLVEVGVVGSLLIAAFMLWAVLVFLRVLWRSCRSRLVSVEAGIAAAALALSGYGIAFPILEPQLLALTWWLFLVLSLKVLERSPQRELSPSVAGRAATARPSTLVSGSSA